MSTTNGRGSRHLFDGTGVYIALFLIVTALAVAGYWTLIPHTPAESPAVPETPAVTVPAPAVKPETAAVPAPEPEPEPAAPQRAQAPALPAQSAVTITLPETVSPDLTPEPPALVVPPLIGEIVTAFSMEELIYSETMGDWRTHDGVDFAAEPGTPVCAVSAGTVTDVRDDDMMGTTVVIAHRDGYDTIYANLQGVPSVSLGDSVSAGQIIGAVGRTALSETRLPSHLHFGVMKDGAFVDPAEYLN